MGGWVKGWIVAHFTKRTRIKAWGQWSEGVGGVPIEDRESNRDCVYEIESENCVIIGGRSTPFKISSCSIYLVDGAQCKCKRKR